MQPQEVPLFKQPSFRTKLTYGAGYIEIAAPSAIQALFFLYFLTSVAGLNASLAGAVLLIGRIWDAINDPLIGWLSDRTQSRRGKRYPWMVLGSIPLGIFFVRPWVIPSLSLISTLTRKLILVLRGRCLAIQYCLHGDRCALSSIGSGDCPGLH